MTEQLRLFTDEPRSRKGEYEVSGDAIERCRSCGALIIWRRTESGKAIPLSVATIEERDGTRFALSHFADCPHAKDWSRR